VLHTGIAWRHLPLALGFGSGATCYRRFSEWQIGGVWERLHALLLAELQAAGETEWSRAVADSSHVQAKKGAPRRGPSPVDRGRNGSKHHLLVDATGIPLAWTVSGGNRNDITQLISLVERVPPVRGTVGRPRLRPERVTADRGYDHDKYRRDLRQRRIKPEIPRRQTEHGSGLGRARWVVERTFAWLHQFKRLLVRYDRRAEIHEAFLALGCCLVCSRRLARSF
jgi:transposase